MKHKLICLIGALFLIANQLSAQIADTSIIPGSIIVMFEKNEHAQLVEKAFSRIHGIPTELKVNQMLSDDMHLFLLKFNPHAINSDILLSALQSSPWVKIAQFDHKVQWRKTPYEPQFDNQWNMLNTGQNSGISGADISATKAWDITTGGLTSTGDTIVVAVIDAGFDLKHEDLNFWKNYNEIPKNKIDDDDNGYVDDFDGWYTSKNKDSIPVSSHGTHICGIIGARGFNNKGVAGINWDCKIMPIVTSGAESDVVASYSYVLKQRRLYKSTNGAKGAFVVATSSSFGVPLGQPSNYPLWCAMYDTLGSEGILSVAATDNKNTNVDVQGDIPTSCGSKWLITVTNTTSQDLKAGNAAYGLTKIDLGAPGTNITSTYPNNTYYSTTGTSMACPHVAGAVALMFSVGCPDFMAEYKANPDSIALIIKDSLLATVDTIPALKNITVTGGRLNLNKAVNSILNRYVNDSCIISPVIPQPLNIETLPSSPSIDITTNGEYGPVNVVNLYPNPVSEVLTIELYSYEDSILQFVNVLGTIVKTIVVSQSESRLQVSVSDLEKGVYFLRFQGKSASSKTIKVVVY